MVLYCMYHWLSTLYSHRPLSEYSAWSYHFHFKAKQPFGACLSVGRAQVVRDIMDYPPQKPETHKDATHNTMGENGRNGGGDDDGGNAAPTEASPTKTDNDMFRGKANRDESLHNAKPKSSADNNKLVRSKSVEVLNVQPRPALRPKAWTDGAAHEGFTSLKIMNRHISLEDLDLEEPAKEPGQVNQLEEEVNVVGPSVEVPNQRSAENMRTRVHRFAKRTYKHALVKLGLYPYAREVNYIILQLSEHILAVIPLTLYLILFIAIFFQQGTERSGGIAGGVVSMVFGLLFFLEGIKISVMPMGEIIGSKLPKKYHLSVFLVVVFCLGVLTTFAEPAIAALTPLAALVEADRTPLLYHLMNDWRQYLVLAIGLGVGTATAIGSWRMLTKRPLLPQIYIVFIPTIALAFYMMWGDSELRSLIGVAWDCGAITTGPITASAILAISAGIGEASRGEGEGEDASASASLGIVTLASLYPILFVEILAIIMSFAVDIDSISGSGEDEDVGGGGDFKQALLDTIQAAFPLLGFLFITLKLIVRKSIPRVSWEDLLEDSPEANADERRARAKNEQKAPMTAEEREMEDADFDAQLQRMAGTEEALEQALKSHPMENYQWSINSDEEGGSYLVPFMNSSTDRRYRTLWHAFPTLQRQDVHHYADDGSVITDVDGKSVTNLEGVAIHSGANDHAKKESKVLNSTDFENENNSTRNEFDVSVQVEDVENIDVGHSASFQQREAPGQTTSFKRRELERLKQRQGWCRKCSPTHLKFWLRRNKFFLVGTTFIPLGLLLINVGIQFGLTPLGDQVGERMPALFMEGDDVKEPQVMPRGIGLVVTSAYIFFLGFFATRAEPALVVLGMTVEELTNGDFSRFKLQTSVACGVGVGVTVGILQIVFDFSVLYVLIAGYVIALTLVVPADHTVRCASWDSGGVTTGPVTVPLILSMGISFGNAVDATQGFGILACASISPIVAVLMVNGATQLSRVWKAKKS